MKTLGDYHNLECPYCRKYNHYILNNNDKDEVIKICALCKKEYKVKIINNFILIARTID